ncbi:hypothetical protein D499_0AV00140 [Hanseniaspora uvarum DSM 2768]|nr:hypothetical protein D499_0AV00140 [Hanseniaspora uvarum DSM 2768]
MLGLKYQVNNLSRYTFSSIPRFNVRRYYSTEGQDPTLTTSVHNETQKINKSLIPLVPDANASITELELQDKLIRSKTKDLDTRAKILTFSNLPLFKPNGKVTIRRPGSTNVRLVHHEHLYKDRPIKPLTIVQKRTGGRNDTGRIVVRHRGGGNKKRLRLVDYFRHDLGKHIVQRIEYDPVRTCHLALIQNVKTSEISYIVAADGLRAGDYVESFRNGFSEDLRREIRNLSSVAELDGPLDTSILLQKIIQRGNCVPYRHIPTGTIIHNIGLTQGGEAKLCRAAGTFGRLVSKDDMKAVILLNSGEQRYVHIDAVATIGMVSNVEHSLEQLGKAGRNRWKGKRPRVRGVAMNKVDHPHGGGRGKSKSNKLSQSYSGVLAKGYKTRRSKYNKNGLKVKDRRV